MSKNQTWSSVFSADVLEFISLSSQFCTWVQQPQEEPQSLHESVFQLQKMLSSLYSKALALSALKLHDDSFLEEYVTEEQYNQVRAQIASLLGNNDDYLDVFVQDMKYSDKPILKTISEDVADIYQPLGNFISSYQTGVDEIMFAALAQVLQSFHEYWGGRSLSAMRALHEFLCNETDAEY